MRMFFFITMIAGLLSTASCNNQNSGGNSSCDSAAITIAMLKKVTAVGFDKQHDSVFDVIASYFPKLKYVSPSQEISEAEAREYHQRYLGSPNPIVDNNKDVVHYLSVNSADLKKLYENGTDGVRLYFCREKTNEFNIVLVPVGQGGRNILSVLINKLEPCPDNCIGGDNRNENLDNDDTDLNKDMDEPKWLKPNKKTMDGKAHWWSKNNKEDRGAYSN